MAAKKKTKVAPIRIHVENNPTNAEVYHVTPALFRKLLRKMPGMAAKIAVSFGNDPGKLDDKLREAEILLTGGFDASNLSHPAPRPQWVQSTSAVGQKLAPYIPARAVLPNARGVLIPKGRRAARPPPH